MDLNSHYLLNVVEILGLFVFLIIFLPGRQYTALHYTITILTVHSSEVNMQVDFTQQT